MLYAIANFKVGRFTTNLICDTKELGGEELLASRQKDYTIITDVSKVKTKQVVMPNGRKAATYIVAGQTWMMYRDGSSEII